MNVYSYENLFIPKIPQCSCDMKHNTYVVLCPVTGKVQNMFLGCVNLSLEFKLVFKRKVQFMYDLFLISEHESTIGGNRIYTLSTIRS